MKKSLKQIRYTIKLAFTESVNNFWNKQVDKISVKDSKNLFPSINKLFRQKEQNVTDAIKIPSNATSLLQDADTDRVTSKADTNGNYTIVNPIDKLNVLGAHFQAVHVQDETLGKQQLNNIIEQKVNALKVEIETDRINNTTICMFTQENKGASQLFY